MSMLKFVENARTNGMIKLNERIKAAMERLQYLMESFLFEQSKYRMLITTPSHEYPLSTLCHQCIIKY